MRKELLCFIFEKNKTYEMKKVLDGAGEEQGWGKGLRGAQAGER